MLHTQSSHYDSTARRQITEITLHLDCGHKASFYGEATQIDTTLATLGVTVGSTGVSRCKECTARYKALLAEVTNTGMIGRRH